jgi:hypothetical protein
MFIREYVSVHFVNYAIEPVKVYAETYLSLIIVEAATVPSNAERLVSVLKGGMVKVYGAYSNKEYGFRTFYSSSRWDIN